MLVDKCVNLANMISVLNKNQAGAKVRAPEEEEEEGAEGGGGEGAH